MLIRPSCPGRTRAGLPRESLAGAAPIRPRQGFAHGTARPPGQDSGAAPSRHDIMKPRRNARAPARPPLHRAGTRRPHLSGREAAPRGTCLPTASRLRDDGLPRRHRSATGSGACPHGLPAAGRTPNRPAHPQAASPRAPAGAQGRISPGRPAAGSAPLPGHPYLFRKRYILASFPGTV